MPAVSLIFSPEISPQKRSCKTFHQKVEKEIRRVFCNQRYTGLACSLCQPHLSLVIIQCNLSPGLY